MSKKQTQKVLKKGQVIPFSKELGEKDIFFQGLSVLDVLGQYFYFARRHKKDIPNYRKITKYRKAHPESIAKCPFDIIPSAQYGWPNELAYKIWTVYEKKLSDTWDVTDGYIHFGDRELARLIGRSGFNDVTSDQFDSAIWQLYDTKIIFWNLSDDGKIKDAPFRLLSHRIRETDIGRGRVVGYTLCAESAWRDFYIKRKMYIAMSWNRISALSPNSHRLARFINQRLASRFAKEGHKNFIFKKDYADICAQWLGGAPARPRIGLIKQHLSTLLSPLVDCGLIRSWEAEKNKSGTGFNVVFKPADGFFEDYEKYLPSQRVLDFSGSQKQINTSHSDVIKLWQHAQEKVFNRRELSSVDLNDNERKYVVALLEKYGYEAAILFINFSSSKLPETGFDKKIKTLNGLSIYEKDFEDYRLKEQTRLQKEADDIKQRSEQKMQSDYELYIDGIFNQACADLGDVEIEKRNQSIADSLDISDTKTNGMSRIQVRVTLKKQLLDEYKALSFEDWLAQSEHL